MDVDPVRRRGRFGRRRTVGALAVIVGAAFAWSWRISDADAARRSDVQPGDVAATPDTDAADPSDTPPNDVPTAADTDPALRRDTLPKAVSDPQVTDAARMPDIAPGDVSKVHDSRLGDGIWVDRSRLALLDTTGPAWHALRKATSRPCGRVDLSDQRNRGNVCVLAKALVFARTGAPAAGDDVRRAIEQVAGASRYQGRALALGRELAAYVIAADLLQLSRLDAPLDARFRDKLIELRTTPTEGGGVANLIECHEERPNNWGTHCGASRVAVAAYLGDADDLARAATVFKGWLGDRSAYAGFRYGKDLSWQCDPSRPVGINPAGCSRDGLSIGGVIPDDQRRGGSFSTSPPHENYVWEALQGALVQAVILERAGYPTFQWEDRALLRAVSWLYDQNNYPAAGDDTWQLPVINRAYGTHFPTFGPVHPGKNVGWTDWTDAPPKPRTGGGRIR